MKLQSTLSRLEEGLQNLVEGGAAKLLSPGGAESVTPPEEAQASPEMAGETSRLVISPAEAEAVPERGYLIVGGSQTFPLEGLVVNVGRLLDNHLVLDDPRVSRHHAQLRALHGRYVIFDLDSTGGTFVNGRRVAQCALHPGDVISLAGVTLIFGQETPALPDTQRLTPANLT